MRTAHYNPKRRHWPHTATEMNQAMGGYGTWASAWLLDEASGTFADKFGAITLTAAGTPGTPTYGNKGAMPGDRAVGFTAGEEDRIQAGSTGTFDLDASTSLAGYLCFRATTSSNRYFLGKVSSNFYGLIFAATPGHVTLQIDGAAGAASTTIAVAHHDGKWHDLIWCIDRTNQRIQVFSDLGSSTEVDITAVTTLTSGAFFFFGSQPFSNVFDLQIAYAAVATADVANLRTNGAAAIDAIRKFTRRA